MNRHTVPLGLHRIKDVPREQWTTRHVAEAMLPLDRMKRLSPDGELWTSLQQMDRDGVSQLPVMADGQVVGMLSREDVITYLRTLQELGM
jgi:predicted transcriptional regulator